MKKEDRTLLTLEERLELAARSQAASPEAAARLVRRFSENHAGLVFCGSADLNLMNELTGEFWDHPAVDVSSYRGFCRSFQLAMENDSVEQEDGSLPFRPVLGERVSNALVLLGLMLLDHAKGRLKRKDIYHCTRMTLGQYLDALEALAFSGEDGPLSLNFRAWRDIFLKHYDRTAPLGEVLADILWHYITGWQELDRLDHILRCMEDLSRYLEQEAEADLDRCFREAMRQSISEMGLKGVEVVEEEEYEHFTDPYGHYLALARQYPANPPDPGSEDAALGSVRGEVFLSARDYSPEALRTLAANSPSPELGALLEKHIDEKRLAFAMREVNMAVTDLYMLWVGPYLCIAPERAKKLD